MRAGFANGLNVFLLLMAGIPAAGAETLFVAPDGRDQWSGTIERPNVDRSDGPLASLAGARDSVRKRISWGQQPEGMSTKICFEPFDFSKAGVYGSSAWTELASGVEYPAF